MLALSLLGFFDGLSPYEQGRIVGRIFGFIFAAVVVRAIFKKVSG